MKNKIFAIALSILMAACLTACKGTAPDSQPGSNSQSISSSASASSQNLELLYGRVSEVAGNELTLDLAKLPGEDEAASAPENRFHLSALSPSGSIRRAAKCDDASAAARLFPPAGSPAGRGKSDRHGAWESASPPAQSAFRRPAAAGSHCPCTGG